MPDRLVPASLPRTTLALTVAGLVPFCVLVAAAWRDAEHLRRAEAVELASVYAGLSLAFLGGIRWGTAIGPIGARQQSRDILLSVLPALAALAGFLLPMPLRLSLFAVAFLLAALWDVLSVEAGRLPDWFGTSRMIFTAGAVLSLLALLVMMFI